jgi:hypothetical protein
LLSKLGTPTEDGFLQQEHRKEAMQELSVILGIIYCRLPSDSNNLARYLIVIGCLAYFSVVLCLTATPKEVINGTAVLLNENGDMITNKHVVSGCDKIFVKLNDGDIHIADILSIGKRFDMAILRVEDVNVPRFAWFRTDRGRHIGIAQEGDSVVYGGFDTKTLGYIDIAHGKVVASPDPVNPDKRFISAMVSSATHGASGSGVFEGTEALVGLIFSGYVDVGIKSKRKKELDLFYGDNVVNFYNSNALIEFLGHESDYKPRIYYRIDPPAANGADVKGHVFLTTALVICYR